jgi:hypothetical protein
MPDSKVNAPAEQTYHYRVYGLEVRTNLRLPCPAASSDAVCDVAIEATGPIDDVSDVGTLVHRKGMESVWRVGPQVWRVVYEWPQECQRVAFDVDASRRHIAISWTPSTAVANIPHIVLGPLLGAWLRLHGRLCLHGGAIVAGTRALLILGASGAGKSSALVSLLAAGGALLTDDVAAVAMSPEGPVVHPGPLFVRLWPDTAQALGYDPAALPRVFEDQPGIPPKRLLDFSALDGRTWPAPAVLRRVYVLERRRGIDEAGATLLSAKDAVSQLLRHTYPGHYLDVDTRPAAFDACVRLAQTCPVYRVHVPDDMAKLPQLARTLLAGAA